MSAAGAQGDRRSSRRLMPPYVAIPESASQFESEPGPQLVRPTRVTELQREEVIVLRQPSSSSHDRQKELVKKFSTVSSISRESSQSSGSLPSWGVGRNGQLQGIESVPPAHQAYINHLKQLLHEAKEELKRRHKTIGLQQRRLEKAEEARVRSRTLFSEMIEKVRMEMEQQEILQIHLHDALARIDGLESQIAEMRWEREQDVSMAAMQASDEEKSLLQQALTRAREEFDSKEQQILELAARCQQFQARFAEVNMQVESLTEQLTRLTKDREAEKEAQEKEAQSVVNRVEQTRALFMTKLRGGVEVLKHGRHGRPKPKLLCMDESGKNLICRTEGKPAKDITLACALVQVVPGKMTYVLSRSSVPSHACFSLIVTGPSGPPVKKAGSIFGTSSGGQRESLDLEVADGLQDSRDELVDGLSLICGTDTRSASMRLTRPPTRV